MEKLFFTAISEECSRFETIILIGGWLGIPGMVTIFYCCETATLEGLAVGMGWVLSKQTAWLRLDTTF
jgi:hypothetical protein